MITRTLRIATYAAALAVGFLLAATITALAAPLAQVSLPQEFGSNYVLASLLVGVLLPALIAKIINRNWSSEVKELVAVVASIGAAALVAYTQGQLSAGDILRSALIVFTVAQLLFAAYYKPQGVAARLNRGKAIDG